MIHLLTHEGIKDSLMKVRGSSPISFVAKTDARLRKKGNPYGTVYKIARVNGFVGFDYNAGVYRRLEKEGKHEQDFTPGDTWHEPVKNPDGTWTPLARHKANDKELYLRVMVNSVGERKFVTESGKELTAEQVAPWLPTPSSYSNQGLDKPLRIEVYKLGGIMEATFGGDTYTAKGA